MQDVKKIDIENKNNHKRDRRRKNSMAGYIVLVAVLTLLILAVLSVTLMFNVHELEISGIGSSVYDEQTIVNSSGIVRGDNLIRMNTGKIRESMLSELVYIDDVQITRCFPDTVRITVTPSVGTAYVECQGGYMLVSKSWRILEHTELPEDKNIIVVNGFDCVSNEEKKIMSSADPDKNEALKSILNEIENQKIEKMVSVDISDKFDIILNYDNRIKIKIEKADDIEYKLRYAYTIITKELRENKNGYLIYRNSLGYSYVSDEEYNRINSKVSDLIPSVTEETLPDLTAAETGTAITETGSPVSETQPQEMTSVPVQNEGW